jgi:hypothetical protein
MKDLIPHDELIDTVDYDPDVGKFYWRNDRGDKVKAGDIAGSIRPDGYRQLRLKGKAYLGHRLAWYYMTGEWPKRNVSPVNNVRHDIRFENLRKITPSVRMMRQVKNPRNSSGYPGVFWLKGNRKWLSSIRLKGQTIYIGSFRVAIDAALARLKYEYLCPDWQVDEEAPLIQALEKQIPGFTWQNFKRGKYDYLITDISQYYAIRVSSRTLPDTRKTS